MISEKQAVFEIIVGELMSELAHDIETGRAHTAIMINVYYTYWPQYAYSFCSLRDGRGYWEFSGLTQYTR